MKTGDDSSAAERSWYLIYAKPRMEPVAEEHLTRQGYGVYLPRVRATHRLRGRYRERVDPLFPRYLFIHLDQCNDNWGPIRSTQGVAGMVRPGCVDHHIARQRRCKRHPATVEAGISTRRARADHRRCPQRLRGPLHRPRRARTRRDITGPGRQVHHRAPVST